MRAYQRVTSTWSSGEPAGAQAGGLSQHEAEDDMYQTMAIANYEDRFVIPSTHRNMPKTPSTYAVAGVSFGNGCSDGASDVSLFGGKKPRTIPDQGGGVRTPPCSRKPRPIPASDLSYAPGPPAGFRTRTAARRAT